VFITGEDDHWGTSLDYGTVAYDAATGAQLWEGRYNGPGDGADYALGLGVSPDSSTVFVTGTGHLRHDASESVTIAYDAATGTERWVKHDPVVGGSKLGVSPDGTKVFLTNDGRIAAVDAATGATLWDNEADQYPYTDLVVGPRGRRVYVTGFDDGMGRDYATVAYDTATGAELWRSTYTGSGYHDDEAYALDISGDAKELFVTGRSYGGATNFDYATVAYDITNGDQLWARRYNPSGSSIDRARDVGVSPDGSKVFVTGQIGWCDTSCGDYATIAYSIG
jgi:glucose dehydrogenase